MDYAIKSYEDLYGEVDNQITYGIEIVTREPVTYLIGTSVYPLTYNRDDDNSVTGLTSQALTVTGTSGENYTEFTFNTDYQLKDNSEDGLYDSIEWLGVTVPDNNTTFHVTYAHQRTPSGLVSTSPGTVTRRLSAAYIRQVYNLYVNTQIGISKVHIDWAEGQDLDNLLAAYGFTRNLSTEATGHITCNRASSASTVVLSAGSTFSKPTSAFGRDITYRTLEALTWWTGRSKIIAPIESVEVGKDCNAADNEINIVLSASNVITCKNEPSYVENSRAVYGFDGGKVYVYSVNVTGTVDIEGIDSTTGEGKKESGIVIAGVLPGTMSATSFSSVTRVTLNPVAGWSGDNTVYIKDDSNPWVAPTLDFNDPTDGDGFYASFWYGFDGNDYLTIPSGDSFNGDGDQNLQITLTHYPTGDMTVIYYDDTTDDYMKRTVSLSGDGDIGYDQESRNMTFLTDTPMLGDNNISVSYTWRNLITDATDRETDVDFRTKAKGAFSTPTVANTYKYEAVVNRVAGVESCVGYDGNKVGWATIPKGIVYLLVTPDTSPMSNVLLGEVNNEVEKITPGGIDVTVIEPDPVYIYVKLQIDVNPSYIGIGVKTSVELALKTYINALAAGEDVKHSELVQASENTLGVNNIIIHEIRYDTSSNTKVAWEGGAGVQAYAAGDGFLAFGDWDVPIGLDLSPDADGLPTTVEVAKADVINITD